VSVLAVLLAAGAGVGIGFAAHMFAPPFPQPVTEPAPVASASESAAPEASAPTPAASESAPSAAASSAAAPAEPPGACMKALFAEGTFADEPPLAFVCEEPNAVKGAAKVKEAVVNAGTGKAPSPGMKEWAVLGFYELAAYAVLRGRCCAGGDTFSAPDATGCPSMNEALQKVASVSTKEASEDDAKAAQKGFVASVKCISQSKASKTFGGYPDLAGGEGSTFLKTLDRARGVPPKKKEKG
jgi:hypothetical protein